jgi:mannose-6-phosphate isomerase
MIDTPLLFTPILVPKVWGGRRLASLGKDLPAEKAIGESWELADLPGDGPCSVAAEGPLAGTSLRELLDTHQTDIMGTVPLNPQGRFPLLIKFLDACDNLSVQVHPDQQWADTHPGAHLKSEAWVVMDAAPGSRIWAGTVPGTTAGSMQAALDSGTLTDTLQWRAAAVGACHDLPSGTCHALGKGVLVAEVQTTSDTTFRLWDWGRTGRTMHVAESLACINFTTPPPPEVLAPEVLPEGITETSLTDTPWFTLRSADAITPMLRPRLPVEPTATW